MLGPRQPRAGAPPERPEAPGRAAQTSRVCSLPLRVLAALCPGPPRRSSVPPSIWGPSSCRTRASVSWGWPDRTEQLLLAVEAASLRPVPACWASGSGSLLASRRPFSLCPHTAGGEREREREREIDAECSPGSRCKGTDAVMGAPPSGPHLNPPASQRPPPPTPTHQG